MAWTAPRDWAAISAGIVTAASLNTDLRDNLGVLSTHTHTGAAGFGASSMSGLTLASLVTLTFADQSANPDAAGELQRNGNDLLWYGSSVVNLTAADASAGTASLRTLGTTSVKAAAGNHTHLPGTPNQTIVSSGGFVNVDDETTIGTATCVVQGASEALAVYSVLLLPDGNSEWTARLKFSGPSSGTISTRTGLNASNSVVSAIQPISLPPSGTASIISSTSAGTYTITQTIERTTTGGTPYVNARGLIYVREVGA
jgi:hypothetical protein